MAEDIIKQAFLTRRDLLKAIAVGTTASIVSTPQALEAEDCSLSISSQEVIAWRRYKFAMSLNVPRIYSNSSSLGYRKY